MNAEPRVLVVDPDDRSRAGLVALLAGDGLAAGAEATAEDALVEAARSRPQLVLTEIRLPGMCGYELLRRLRDAYGDGLPVVLMSAERTESFDRVAGMLLGADDYVVRPFAPDELLVRLRRRLRASAPHTQRGALTRREREVLGLLAAGKNQREISAALVIAPKTCSKHIERILEKLGVHSRAQAVAAAYRDGLLAVH